MGSMVMVALEQLGWKTAVFMIVLFSVFGYLAISSDIEYTAERSAVRAEREQLIIDCVESGGAVQNKHYPLVFCVYGDGATFMYDSRK